MPASLPSSPRSTGARTLIALALLGLLALPATAQWKWRDARGQITLSDMPPPREVPERDILQRPDPQLRRALAAPTASAAPAASAASAPLAATPTRTGPDPQADARKRAEQDEAAKAKAEDKRLANLRAENCRRAKSQLAALESGLRMARFNEKGEQEVLDDAARAQETRAARALIESDCR